MKSSELDYFYGRSSVLARVKSTREYVGEYRLTLEEIKNLTKRFHDAGMPQEIPVMRQDFTLNEVFEEYLFAQFNKKFNITDDTCP